MAQFARPNADISNPGSWSPSTGATLYGCIDEASRSDTDYIQSYGGVNYDCVIGLGAVSDPGVGTGHVLRFVYRSTDGEPYLAVSLYDGAALIANLGYRLPSTSFALVEYTLTSTQADAISAAGYAGALRVRCLPYTAGEARVQVSWAELEVPALPVTITGDSSVALPLGVSGAAVALIVAVSSMGLPFGVSGNAAVPIVGSSSVALPFGVSGTGTAGWPATVGDSTVALPFTAVGAGVAPIVATSSKALPFGVGGTATAPVVGASSVILPLGVVGTGTVAWPVIMGMSSVALPPQRDRNRRRGGQEGAFPRRRPWRGGGHTYASRRSGGRRR